MPNPLALLDRVGTWRGIAILVLLCLGCFYGFGVRLEKLATYSGGKPLAQIKILDARFWYTPADARSFFGNLGAAGRKAYAISELTLDLVFLATYGLLFAVLIRHLYPPKLAWLVVLPFAASTFDLLENVTLAYLAWTYAGKESPAAGLGAIFTVAKTAFYVASVLLVLVGTLRKAAGATSPV
jgi:hypothetical protein